MIRGLGLECIDRRVMFEAEVQEEDIDEGYAFTECPHCNAEDYHYILKEIK